MKAKTATARVFSHMAYGALIISTFGWFWLPTGAAPISITDTVYTATSYTIPTTTTDWWLAGRNEKKDGTAITSITPASLYDDPGILKFSYSDGATTPESATDVTGRYYTTWGDPGDPITITINVPTGSGQVMLFATSSNQYGHPTELKASFSGDEESSTAAYFLFGDMHQLFVDYTSLKAQELVLVVTPEKNNSGIYAVTVSSVVPEPSAAILLAAGLGGLLCRAWRKRN